MILKSSYATPFDAINMPRQSNHVNMINKFLLYYIFNNRLVFRKVLPNCECRSICATLHNQKCKSGIRIDNERRYKRIEVSFLFSFLNNKPYTVIDDSKRQVVCFSVINILPRKIRFQLNRGPILAAPGYITGCRAVFFEFNAE